MRLFSSLLLLLRLLMVLSVSNIMVYLCMRMYVIGYMVFWFLLWWQFELFFLCRCCCFCVCTLFFSNNSDFTLVLAYPLHSQALFLFGCSILAVRGVDLIRFFLAYLLLLLFVSPLLLLLAGNAFAFAYAFSYATQYDYNNMSIYSVILATRWLPILGTHLFLSTI